MHLSKQDLREDVYQLVHLLTESHPDPYSAGGGPIAFHRRVEHILTTIPEKGLSTDEFLRLLRPLVATIQDGHTWIGPSASSQTSGPHPWLHWSAVEQQLYVSTVYRGEDEWLLGSRLQALEGVPFPELVSRVSQSYGCDNEYQKLIRLANTFSDPPLLADILMRDELPQPLHLTILLSNGKLCDVEVPLYEQAPGKAIEPTSTISLPELNAANLGWSFLDPQRQTACLRTTSMMHYREAFEYSYAVGNKLHLDYHLDDTVRQALQGQLPESIEAKIAAIPSATDLLRDLFSKMQQAHTSYLIVDVRHNPGGNSLFASILEYFLYGLEEMINAEISSGYQIRRYSPLYFQNVQSQSPEQYQELLRNGGYDFSKEQAWQQLQQQGMSAGEREEILKYYDDLFSSIPTFASIFEKRLHEAAWTPRVLVLTSANTYSAGFDIALTLLRHGATILGVPSSQAGNCFIDALFYHLKHSGLEGGISYKQSLMFPNDPERGKLLRPDLELSYDDLAAQQFDPNTAVKLALEYIAQMQKQEG